MNRFNKEVIFLQGGLGNQMFQYAFYLAKKYKKSKVKYDTGLLRLYNQHNGYELEKLFNIRPHSSLINLMLLYFLKKMTWLNKLLTCRICLLRDCMPSIFIPSYLNPHKKTTLYYGYWQTEKYFIDIKENVLNTFSFNETILNQPTKTYLNEIRQTNSISIHIRRGDYLLEKNETVYGNICTLNYYKKAIQKIIEAVANPTFYIFSNEIEWVQKNMDMPHAIYVCCNYKNDSWQDMYLMSQCKHNIIANSSFSWWGAWLNQNPNKIIISPSKFINIGSNADIIPESWIKIKND